MMIFLVVFGGSVVLGCLLAWYETVTRGVRYWPTTHVKGDVYEGPPAPKVEGPEP
jgi:hypothetical protein